APPSHELRWAAEASSKGGMAPAGHSPGAFRLRGPEPFGGGLGGRGRLAPLVSRLLSWVGVAITSGSVAVAALAVLASAVQVMMHQQTGSGLECATHPSDSVPSSTFDLRTTLAEGALALELILAAAVLQGLKGVLPIL
ncbi:MAG: hypothetical protein ACREJ6_13360, partial [Candidatus Methylomirabilis sp.]